ncbi:MAG: bifunctional diaminohydroxyphosphoribosylaminopyrimidine deaminase/5-amino-6-(5-phosphoribosylamino)uracil reductase RibD [Puniceicoccaceae bacterium]
MDAEVQMRLAIEEARKAMGKTHPNPAVGAVITHKGEVIASGFTQPAGQDHAEVVALKAMAAIGLEADESTTLAVTLEPCSTVGRTGACTDAIAEAGIRHVLVGATDPNPAHAGKGFDVMRSAGIKVETGILEQQCADLNLIFNWQMSMGMPLIAGKIATTLDGRIATATGSSKWITGPAAREDVHRWRRYFPAIAVGAGTVLTDNPSLTARLPDEEESCPIRFIFDRRLLSVEKPDSKVFFDQWKQKTVVVTSTGHGQRLEELRSKFGIEFWEVDGLRTFISKCRDNKIWGVYVEGGNKLLSSFLNEQMLSYLFWYRAPKFLADAHAVPAFSGQASLEMEDAYKLSGIQTADLDDDQLTRGFVVYPD